SEESCRSVKGPRQLRICLSEVGDARASSEDLLKLTSQPGEIDGRRQFHKNAFGDAAARNDDSCRGQSLAGEKHARTECEASRHAVGFFRNSRDDLNLAVADGDEVTKFALYPKQQVIGYRHRFVIKANAGRVQLQPAIEGIAREIRALNRNKNRGA